MPKKKFWYRVRFAYYSKGIKLFSWDRKIGFDDQSLILLNDRAIRNKVRPLHKDPYFKSLHKLLANGEIKIETISYLGRIRDKQKWEQDITTAKHYWFSRLGEHYKLQQIEQGK